MPLSSTARLMSVTCPFVVGVQAKLQEPRPVARRHVLPPSVDTSIPPTTPPLSVAVPLMVTDVPVGNVAPVAGDVIADVGGTESVDGCPGNNPAWRFVG